MLLAVSMLLVGVATASQPIQALAAGPLPACRYDDVRTDHTAYSQWRITLLDPIFKVPQAYKPPKLVSVKQAGFNGGGKVRRLLIDDLAALARAARQADAPLRVVSAYRSYDTQASLFRREVRNKGEAAARISVARPGHSEHQLGTALDFGSGGNGAKPWQGDWGQTKAGAWMRHNGWKFGFVMSYPKGKKSVTCYKYEPWHWRYVGREMAADIRASGLTLREYLWRHYH
jgi:D-alanyl-D-alanine carboxypeptidase